jgi:hypothetical protein
VKNNIEHGIEQCLTIYVYVKLPAYPEDYFEVRSDLGIVDKNFGLNLNRLFRSFYNPQVDALSSGRTHQQNKSNRVNILIFLRSIL